MLVPPVSRFMTIAPCTAAAGQSVTAARRLMEDHQIRHLPVVDGPRLVGIVSQRDLDLLRTLRAAELDDDEVTVADAMSRDVLAVPEDAPLDDVVAKMVDHKYGSAVVVRRDTVVGIFTAIDALCALRDLLGHAEI